MTLSCFRCKGMDLFWKCMGHFFPNDGTNQREYVLSVSDFHTTGFPSVVMPSASTAITVFLLLLYSRMTASPLLLNFTLGVQ